MKLASRRTFFKLNGNIQINSSFSKMQINVNIKNKIVAIMVMSPFAFRAGEMRGLGMFRRVQQTGGGRVVCRVHADTDHTGCH